MLDFIQKEDEKENHKATRCEKKPKSFGKTKETLKNEKIKFIKFKFEKGDISLSTYLFEISLFTADLKTFLYIIHYYFTYLYLYRRLYLSF